MSNANTSNGEAGAPQPPITQAQNQEPQDTQGSTTTEAEQERKRQRATTEAEARSVDGKAGQSQKSSHDHMGHVKAGTHEGAGGGAKSQRHH